MTEEMTDTNKMREEFEMWAEKENKWLIDRDSFGNYVYGFVRDSWNAWQASRQAVVVELPSFDGYVDHIVRELQAAFTEQVEAQGLRVGVSGRD